MADAPEDQSSRISRRSLMAEGTAALVVGGAVALWTIARASQVEAATKVTPAMASYQTSPKGDAKCETCSHFQAPSSCDLVDGPISPNGWCSLFEKKG